MATSQNIEDMKLPELRELAKQMGLRGTSTMRKPNLIATLQAARTGGAAPAGVSVRAPKKTTETVARSSAAPAEAAGPQQIPPASPSPTQTPFSAPAAVVAKTASASKTAAKNTSVPQAASQATFAEASAPKTASGAASDDAHASTKNSGRRDGELDRRGRVSGNRDRRHQQDQGSEANLLDELHIDIPASDDSKSTRIRRRETTHATDDQPRRRRRSDTTAVAEPTTRDLDDILAALPADRKDGAQEQEQESQTREFTRRPRNHDRSERGGDDRRQRRMRSRDRDFETRDDRRDNRDNRDEREERDNRRDNRREDNRREENPEDFVPVAGIVDVLDSYAFVRTSGYLPGPNDVYVSMGQVKKYGLRKGDAVHGSIRTPREGERRNQRQKFVPLQSIDTINGMSAEQSANRPHFSKLTPLYPQERLKQETTPNKITGRLIDIVSPIGKGQRGLIVSPPKAGKTITLQNIANSIATNNPEVHLMVVLVDERPEEVTDMERTVQGEVISSTFDRPASDHTTVAELAIERAKRLVELGQDVVVLLDSMTRLARAYNISAPTSGRILSGGVDAQALYPPKKFFGAARNIENGGSLTIISSALVETGSKMDEVIFEEFKGTGNMELRLSRELADKRLFPAIDINASGTRREELITPNDELAIIYRLRRVLGGLEPEQAYQMLVTRLKKTPTNRDFLSTIVQPNLK